MFHGGRPDAQAVDGGFAEVSIGGWLKGYGGSDRPEIWAVFQDSGGSTIGQTAKVGSNTPAWERKAALAGVPTGTRAIALHLSGTRHAGTDNDGSADEFDLRLPIGDPCRADLNADGRVNPQDVLAFLNLASPPNRQAPAVGPRSSPTRPSG